LKICQLVGALVRFQGGFFFERGSGSRRIHASFFFIHLNLNANSEQLAAQTNNRAKAKAANTAKPSDGCAPRNERAPRRPQRRSLCLLPAINPSRL